MILNLYYSEIFFIARNNSGASFMSKAFAKSAFFKEIDK